METTQTETPTSFPPTDPKKNVPVKRSIEPTIHTVFKMLAQIERLTDSEIKRQVFSTQSTSPEETLLGLSSTLPPPENPLTPEEFQQQMASQEWPAEWEACLQNKETQALIAQAVHGNPENQKTLLSFLERTGRLQPQPKTKLATQVAGPEKITCANLLHSLGENHPQSSKDDLDLVRRIRTIKTLRDQITNNFLSSARAEFDTKSEREVGLLAEALHKFLAAAKEKEIFYCTRDLVEWGKQDFKRSSHNKIQGGKIPDEFLETAYCLTQICLGNRKTLLPIGSEKDALQAAEAFTKIKNPLLNPQFPALFEKRAHSLLHLSFSEPILADIQYCLEKLNPDEKSQEELKKEIGFFQSSLEKIGTDLETYDELQKKEIQSFKTIRDIYKSLTSESNKPFTQFSESKGKIEKKLLKEKIEAFLQTNPADRPLWEPHKNPKKWNEESVQQKKQLEQQLQSLLKKRVTHPQRLQYLLRELLQERHHPSFGQRILIKENLKKAIQELRETPPSPTPLSEIRQKIRQTAQALSRTNKRIQNTSLQKPDYEKVLSLLNPSEVKTQIFQAIHQERPGTEAAPALILTNQLFQKTEWVLDFLQNGPNSLYSAPEAQNLFEIFQTNPSTYSLTSQENPEESSPLYEAFRLLEIADNTLSQPKLQRAIEEELLVRVPANFNGPLPSPEENLNGDGDVSPGEVLNFLKSLENRNHKIYATTKTEIEETARKIHFEGTSSNDAKTPLENTLTQIKEKAEQLSQTLQKEMEGAQGSIESLPKILRNKEDQDTTEAALVRTLAHFYKPNFREPLQNVHQALLQELSEKIGTPPDNLEKALQSKSYIQYQKNEERREVVQLLSSKEFPTQSLTESEKKETIHLVELLATTQSLLNLAGSQKSEKTFEDLMRVLSHKAPPRTPAEHAFVSLCDNASLLNIKIKTADILARVETAAKDLGMPLPENFGAIIKSNIYTLKEWREQDTGITSINFLETNFQGYQKETDPNELALALCKTPDKLKELIRKDLKAALKTCLKPKMWRHPNSVSPQDIGAKNSEYLIMKGKYQNSETNLFKKLKALDQATKTLDAALKNTPEDKTLALSWHFQPKTHLTELFQICARVASLPPNEDLNSLFTKPREKNLAQKLLKNPKLLEVAQSLEENPKLSLGQLENSALDALLEAKNPQPALEYLHTWNKAIGHQYYLTGHLEKPLHLPLIASRIQNKVFNLLELGKHISRVAKNPETLAQTLLQQIQKQNRILRQKDLEERVLQLQKTLNKNKTPEKEKELQSLQETLQAIRTHNSTEDWVKRTQKQRENLERQIEEKHKTIEQKKNAFEEQDWEEMDNGDEHKRLAKMQIQTDRRQLSRLVLKKERLTELLQISNTLKENPEIQDIAAALVERPEAQNFGEALDKALKAAYSLASSPCPLPLTPQSPEIPQEADIYDMLEASQLQEELDEIRETLKDAGTILSQYNPKAQPFDYTQSNLKKLAHQLQDSAFECLKASELDGWTKGGQRWNPKGLQEELIKRNPRLVKSKEKWQLNLKKAEDSGRQLLEYLESRKAFPSLSNT